MTTLAVIPARYGSTRFPGKPLAKATGKYLIQHVCERVCQAKKVSRAIVATDDERILAAVRSFGGEAVMTRPDHPSGTDRVAEVVAGLGLDGDDLVLNVQGDEPEIEPEALDRLVGRMLKGPPEVGIGTLAVRFDDDGPRDGPGSPLDPNAVKVVVDADGSAMYFSRSLVPYPRRTDGAVDRPSRWLLHLGVYAFRIDTLREITSPPRAKAAGSEELEGLEQLRWLSRGFPIAVEIVEHGSVGIDTPDDYAAFAKRATSGV